MLDNPYTGETIAEVPFLSKEEQDKKLEQANKAYRDNRFRKLDDRKSIVDGMISYFREVTIPYA